MFSQDSLLISTYNVTHRLRLKGPVFPIVTNRYVARLVNLLTRDAIHLGICLFTFVSTEALLTLQFVRLLHYLTSRRQAFPPSDPGPLCKTFQREP